MQLNCTVYDPILRSWPAAVLVVADFILSTVELACNVLKTALVAVEHVLKLHQLNAL